MKNHAFFKSIDFDTLYLKTPPRPSKFRDEIDSVSESTDSSAFLNTEPGLSGQQLSRLLGLQLSDEPSNSDQTSASAPSEEVSPSIGSTNNAISFPTKKSVVNFPANEQQLQARLLRQQETQPQWHNLVDKKLILKQGLIDKRKVVFLLFGILLQVFMIIRFKILF